MGMMGYVAHAAVRWFQSARRLMWFFTRPETIGVHAIPITPKGKIVLVTLSYAHGWRLPGGGRKASEDAREAALRELREEIGMVSHGGVEEIGEFDHRPDFRKAHSSLFIVRDVIHRPKWSLEIKEVEEFDLDQLPPDTARITKRLLAGASGAIAGSRGEAP